MKKTIIVGFAILAVSTSAALAKAKGHAKPKTDAAATTRVARDVHEHGKHGTVHRSS